MKKAITILVAISLIFIISFLFLYHSGPTEPSPKDCMLHGDFETLEINREESYVRLTINNLTSHNVERDLEIPWSSTPWDNNSKNQSTPLFIFDSEGFLEFNRNWTYIDVDKDGIISEGDEILVYGIYEEGYEIRLGSDIYVDPNEDYANGCSLITITIEGEIKTPQGGA